MIAEPVRRREHQPAAEAALEVAGDAEAGEDAAERRRLQEHEGELERRVAVGVVEARRLVDPRQPAGEGGEEEQREDQRRDQQRRVGDEVVQVAPGDRAGDRPNACRPVLGALTSAPAASRRLTEAAVRKIVASSAADPEGERRAPRRRSR